jgi:hypothetical protein
MTRVSASARRMRRRAPEVMLFRAKRTPTPAAARVLLTLGLVTCSTACLVPPDGQPVPRVPNYPPQVNLSSVRPKEAWFQRPFNLGSDCLFTVSVDEITDQDSDDIAYRFVANNNVPARAFLMAKQDRLSTAAGPATVEVRLSPRDFLPNNAPGQSNVGHALSLFLTDSTFKPVTSSRTIDFGQIDPGPNADKAVIELRWAVYFYDSAEACPNE